MAAYRRVYDSRHLQADCQEPGSAPEPYARQSSMGYLYLSTVELCYDCLKFVSFKFTQTTIGVNFLRKISIG